VLVVVVVVGDELVSGSSAQRAACENRNNQRQQQQQQQHQLAGVRRAHVRVLHTARSGAALERFLSQGSSAPESELPLGIHPVSHLSFDSHS
jgi:hypothetical protein